MKTNYNVILTLLLAFTVHFTFAQKTISGTVSDETGPLPGVSVLIKGTSTGTETDFDGKYSILANKGDVLQYSFVGTETAYRTVGSSNTLNVVLKSGELLEEVVVTALGIKREKKALGYAVSSVDTDEIQSKPESDISRVLQGKVAGVNIIPTGGMVGSGNSVNIRSKISILGDNQPLYVVDGVPFTSTTDSPDGFTGFAGASASSRSLDLDPNMIESISILKGFSATALYGNKGRNGVILVTTKNGNTKALEKGFEVAISQTTSINQISNLPNYQNKYGQGAGLNYNNNYIGNWGPKFDSDMMVAHNYDKPWIIGVFPEYEGLTVPYKAVPDNVSSFFDTGIGSNTSVNLSKGGEKANANLNFSRASETGYIPNNSVTRTTVGLGSNIKLTNKLNFDASLNYANTDFRSPPVSAANGSNFGSSVFSRTVYIPRNFDLMNLPYQNPIDGSNIYYRDDLDNPRWLLENAGNVQAVNRFFGKVGMNFNLHEKANLSYRIGFDQFTEEMTQFANKGGQGMHTEDGMYRNAIALNKTIDHSLIATIQDIKYKDIFNLNVIVGANVLNENYDYSASTFSEQILFDWHHANNFGARSDSEWISKTNTLGVYSQLEMDFFNHTFLTLSGRNDWSSTVEEEYQSLFYPSFSLSFIPTTAFKDLKGSIINFLKLRGGFASTAGYPEPYNTRSEIITNTTGNGGGIYGEVITQTISNELANPNLKPELHKEIELGVEAKLFNNRIDIDASVYRRNSTDQILPYTPLTPESGFTTTTINAGSLMTDGIEISFNFKPIKNENFVWDINTNFTAYETTVVELVDDLENVGIAGFWGLGNYAVEGEPLGVIIGSYAPRDENGNYLINYEDGTVVHTGFLGGLPWDPEIIGDPNPDWQATLSTGFNYKGFTLGGQLEYTHGGDVYSLTASNLLRRGVTFANIIDREGAVVLPGTLVTTDSNDDGTYYYYVDPAGNVISGENGENLLPGESPNENTIPITVNSLYFLNIMDNDEANVYDGSLIRLREVSLTYSIPRELLKKTPFGSMSLGLTANNIWFDAINFPDDFNFDPGVISTGAGNGQGLDFQTAPSAKKFGFNIRATF